MFEQVKQEIDDKIKTNGNNEITATRLNGVLQDMMDASAEVIEEVQQSVGTQVEANPTGEATETMQTIKIGETIYTASQGQPGEPGTSSYLHLAYATSTPQHSYDMHYEYQTGDKYIGIRVDNMADVPSLPSQYTWMKFIGDDGTNGTNAYVHIKYAASATPQVADMHPTPQTGDKWIGVYSGNLEEAPTAYTSYVWSKYVGDKSWKSESTSWRNGSSSAVPL